MSKRHFHDKKIINLIKFKIIFLTFILNQSLSSQAFALKYFGFESVSPLVIERPYKTNSQEHKSQIEQVILMQKTVELEEIDKALEERKFGPENIINHVYKSITREKFPNLYLLLDNVGDTSRSVASGIKDYWKVSRPYEASKEIQPLISKSDGYCYPSGHSTGGYSYALVMALLIPEKNKEFCDYAHRMSWHRVQVGMHYPSDVEAGKKLAIYLVDTLKKNPKFQNDLKKARQELIDAGIIFVKNKL